MLLSDMQNTKLLQRSKTDKVIAGVASGLANYINIDPIFMRIGFILLSIYTGIGVLLYIILWLLLPQEGKILKNSNDLIQENAKEIKEKAQLVAKDISNQNSHKNLKIVIGLVIIGFGFYSLLKVFGINIYLGFNWIVPIALIIFGVILLSKNNE